MWTSQRRCYWQNPAGSFCFGESQPGTAAAVRMSNGDGLIGFLKISCRHDFIIQRRNLGVAPQPDTIKPPQHEAEFRPVDLAQNEDHKAK